jgi:hypothetical protein
MSEPIDIDKQRRDLYAISLSIIAYNLANGSLKPDSTVLFGAMSVGRPWVLLFGAAIVWCYFLWRFLLVSTGARGRFQQDVQTEILQSELFIAFTRERLSAVAKQLDERIGALTDVSNGLVQNEKDLLAEQKKKVQELIDAGWTFLPTGETGSLSGFKNRALTSRGMAIQMLDYIDESKWSEAEKIVLDESMRKRILRTSKWRARARRHTFSDQTLPLSAAFLAPVTVVARVIWNFLR